LILEVFAWSDNCNTDPFSGVGCDAKVALDIHNLREENPERFYSQVMPACLLPEPPVMCITLPDSFVVAIWWWTCVLYFPVMTCMICASGIICSKIAEIA